MTNTTQAPQDSVLRRHWEASRQQTQPNTASVSSSNTSNQASSGGFFAWLKSLFS